VEYRGIQLHESVKLYNKDGSYKVRIKSGLDEFLDCIFIKKYEVIGNYEGYHKPLEIKCEKGHIVPRRPSNVIAGNECPKCRNVNNHIIEEYRGIKLDENLKLINKDGSYKIRIQRGLDAFIDYMETTNLKVVGIYKGYNNPINIECEKGHTVPRRPSNVMRDTECPYCSGNSNDQAREQFYKNIKEWGYTVFDDYVDSKTLLNGLCAEGHKIKIKPRQLTQDIGCCRKCRPTITAIRTNEQAKKEFPLIVKSKGHELLSEYIDSSIKVLIDFKCGHNPHLITPRDYKSDYGCPHCFDLKRGQTAFEQGKKNFMKSLKKHNAKALTDYKGYNEPILIDILCPHENKETTPQYFMNSVNRNGNGCTECAEESKVKFHLSRGYKRLVKILKERGDTLLSDYEGLRNIGKIHFNCGHIGEVRLSDYANSDVGCQTCYIPSKGEKIIRDWLDENYIEHSKGRISKIIWYYDIIIPSENLIVEVHGSQHYEECEWTRRTLEEEQENDRKKQEHAEKLGYQYLAIDYREHKPKLALKRFLKEFERIRRCNASTKPENEQMSLF
jgi:hypothetical protein